MQSKKKEKISITGLDTTPTELSLNKRAVPSSFQFAIETIISALLPDDITAEKSESQTFINGILYDAIGSRLLETICTFAPGKLFKQIYRTIFKDRIAAVAG